MSDPPDPPSPTQPLAYRSNQPPLAPVVACGKCGTTMVQGVTFAAVSTSTSAGRPLWVQRQTRRNWLGQVVIPKGKCYEVIAYRCPACGLVESYTPPG